MSLRAYLDGPHASVRDTVREHLAAQAGVLTEALSLDRDAYRDRVLELLLEATKAGHTARGLPKEFGGEGDLGGFVAGFETLAYGDLSLLVKAGVQVGLFGGAILHLGTAGHHERYLADAVNARLLGCFAMTETGHGSNVQALRTTATYSAGEFVIHTPSPDARKDYIGNAARHGRMAAVFAQLVVGGETHGVHCLLVPIRSAAGEPLPGVTIEDCGPKLGLNGVDNGRLTFDQVRVPRAALLDRYAQVDASGSAAAGLPGAPAPAAAVAGADLRAAFRPGGAGDRVRPGLQ